MSLINRAKNNNFPLPLSRLGKLEQKLTNTLPNNLSLTLDSNKLPNLKKDHRKVEPKQQHSPLPSKQLLRKVSRDNDSSSKQNAEKEYTHLNNFFPLPPIDRENNSAVLALENLYLPIPLTKNTLTNPEKARMIRELNLKIQLLQSKSKQPGLRLQDLTPLREEIYNKFDQYYITNRQTRSRFIDNDQHDIQHQKVTARSSRARKASKELSAAHFKIDSKTSSPRSSLSRQSSCQDKSKPHSSKLLPSCDEETVNRKTYKTMANISVVSLTNRSNNQEDYRPVFETQLSEKQFIDLDRDPERKMSEQEEEHHQSYIELKENVRIMEERIGFLIHRLEENKKQITSLKDCKERMEKNFAEKEKERSKSQEKMTELNSNYATLQTEHKKLKEKYDQKQKENTMLERQSLRFQKSISQLTNEIEYLTEKVKIKENQLNSVEQLLIQKKVQCEQLGHNLRSIERDFAKKRKELICEIQEKDHETEQLKNQLKEQKARMQIEGINFKFEEAAKLKKYIEENQLLHQREIQKLDSSYSSVITNYEQENRRIKNEKIQLQNALIQWLGAHNKLERQEKHHGQSKFKSDLIKLEAIELKIGELSGNQISNEFLLLLHNYSKLERELNEQITTNEKLQENIIILKEEYSTILEKKCEQIETLSDKVSQLASINKILLREKQELQEQVREIKQAKKETKPQPTKKSAKILLKVMEYRYPQPELVLTDNGTSFQKIIQKMVKVPLKRKLQVALKLIDLALSFTNKKKYPTLNPACLTVQFTSFNQDFSIEISKTAKIDEDQNLHFCSPEVLLGFNESHQSHCWTIGIILDHMIHGKEYFNQYSQIISRKENYSIRDEKYKSLEFLNDMLRKNQKQRISLEQVKQKIIKFLAISHLY